MKKAIGIILIILALVLGYVGVNEFQNSGKSVDILGVELSVEDKQDKTTAYLEIGGAILLLIGGIVLVGKKN